MIKIIPDAEEEALAAVIRDLVYRCTMREKAVRRTGCSCGQLISARNGSQLGHSDS
jgi:hypothetical protein